MSKEEFFNDYREDAAVYYDQFCHPPPGDVAFYLSRVTGKTRVLELGCGTGRVTLPLLKNAGYVHGLDISPGMLTLCQEKLEAEDISEKEAQAELADITVFDLTDRMPKFDLIIAPFRVMQNLESDEEVSGLMRCIRRHLAPTGEAILNTFNPRGGVDEVKAVWEARDGSKPTWSVTDGDQTVTMTDNCLRYREEPLTVFPDLIYRRYDAAGKQLDETVLTIAMRVWYPEQLVRLVDSDGFQVTDRFGGYEGESWGEGSELVIAFRHRDT